MTDLACRHGFTECEECRAPAKRVIVLGTSIVDDVGYFDRYESPMSYILKSGVTSHDRPAPIILDANGGISFTRVYDLEIVKPPPGPEWCNYSNWSARRLGYIEGWIDAPTTPRPAWLGGVPFASSNPDEDTHLARVCAALAKISIQ